MNFDDMIKRLADAAAYLQIAPAWVMVVIASIALGYILKIWKLFPNQLIPVCIVPFAILIEIALMWPAKQSPLMPWIIRQAIIGMVLGFSAWILHRVILRRFEDRFPWLKSAMQDSGFDSTPPFPPAKPEIAPPAAGGDRTQNKS